MKDLANNLASYGRYGDSMLMHVQPREVAGLQALAEANGTSLTINPDTGLPEAFSLGDMFSALVPTAVGFMLGGPAGGAIGTKFGATAAAAAPFVGGALTGAAMASAKDQDPLMGALTGGLGGYGGGSLAGKVGSFGQAAAAPTQPELVKAIPNEMAASIAAPVPPPPSDIPFTMATDQGTTNFFGASQPMAAVNPSAPFETGLQNVMNDPMDFLSQNKMAVGMPLGMAALSGIEPSDLYPSNNLGSGEDKYDPYARLNLSGGTPLRLYAGGGSISAGGLRDLYGTSDNSLAPMYSTDSVSRDGFGIGRLNTLAENNSLGYAEGGLAAMASKKGGYLDGAGDGMSDSIPATIEGRQPARLADGEFVVPADVVSHIGNGSSKAGAKRLYAMLDKVRHARTGNKKQGKQINPSKYLPA